jgi:hypothetical protein
MEYRAEALISKIASAVEFLLGSYPDVQFSGARRTFCLHGQQIHNSQDHTRLIVQPLAMQAEPFLTLFSPV